MKLLTKKIETSLPSIASAEPKSLDELQAVVKFFHPLAKWKWFVFAGDKTGDDFLMYGKVFNSDYPGGKLGYFSLSQLLEINIPFGPTVFKVERDKLFQPCAATKISL
jgi:hypothetical protein